MRSIATFILLLFIGISEIPSGKSFLFLGKFPTPKITPSPININTSEVTQVNLPPLTLHAGLKEKVNVTNTGKSVFVILNERTTSFVTGGAYGKNKYKFSKLRYALSNDTQNGKAGTTIDGVGYPLAALAYFHNIKCHTFQNCLKYRKGIATVTFSVGICEKTNQKFKTYAPILKKVQQPGSTATTTLGNAILWYDGPTYIPKDTPYYAFPGSYLDENTGQRYYSTIITVFPHYPPMCISQKQFDATFGSLKDSSGNPMNNAKPKSESNVTVVEGHGLVGF